MLSKHNPITRPPLLIPLFLILFIAVLGISFFSLEFTRRLDRSVTRDQGHFRAIAGAAAQISSDAFRAESHLFLFLLYGKKIDHEKVDTRLRHLNDRIILMESLALDPISMNILKEIKSRVNEAPKRVSRLLELTQKTEFDFTAHEKIVIQTYETFSSIRKMGTALGENALSLEEQAVARGTEGAKNLRKLLYYAITGVLSLILVLGILLIRASFSLSREMVDRKQIESALKQSEKQLKMLTAQSEQLSLAAAQMISLPDKEAVFQKISNAIVAYSDYERVVISLFKPTHPYRDIVGFAGIEAEKVDHLRRLEFSKTWFDDVFDKGIQIGRFSYYIPHTIKHLLKRDAIFFGEGPVPSRPDTWHPQDNLFVRMNDDKGEFIGVISVDDSKSGEIPSDRTIRPLETFSSLISQIIILKREQEKRQMAETQLQHSMKMESIGTLAGGIAHDFNNILGIILGNAELGLEEVHDTHPSHRNLDEIRTASLRAADIVRQLLSFSRKADQKLEPVDIIPVIEETLNFLRASIPATVEIKNEIMDSPAVIMADPVQINRILMNLCINAFQAMEDEKGRVSISVQRADISQYQSSSFSSLSPGTYVKIMVSDTGKGIPKDLQARIFDPYFTTKEMGRGSGMGLSVVVGIVKAHDGTIWVESEEGRGSRFTICLPLAKGLPQPLPPMEESLLPAGPERILFIDDDTSITDIYSRILTRLGYEVQTFNHPEAALEGFKNAPKNFDLIITDMTMPRMTGAELAREILSIDPDFPIIICTGHSDLLDEHQAREMGISAYVAKPIVSRELALTIRRALEPKH